MDRAAIRRIMRLAFGGVFIALMLMVAAGRLDWWAGWGFVGVYLGYMLALVAWGVLRNPAVLSARGRGLPPDTPRREIVILTGLAGSMLLLLAVAALDAGRFGWSQVSPLAQAAAWLLFFPGAALAVWALLANPFAIAVVVTQPEDHQHVIHTGPYRFIRHPMNAGAILFALCAPVALGSWWALIPGGVMAILILYRTRYEDRFLHAELPGYAKYARQTRYRLLPGVW